ncbi:thioredoxin [Gellertiella hungarica]|uniref:Thioredoxin n=1 Tax=Gellertiella hungarica TaxID=1572859 RepID=A0A7W6NKX4_9HYPH|nr:thioredoxin [Gellertiella hungarica]MBB4065303.1 putative thioredoxin [Gellertiella hungarica]
MNGSDNPYSASFGNQMTASVNGGGSARGGHVKDTTTAAFARDVLEESRHQPVLVDFWAPWCGPCKQLAPAIEKVVEEAAGRVKLVKLNIDDHPAIPGQLGIQSIPAVIAFVNGRPVDGFMGAIPEGQIRQFIDKVAGPAGADHAAEIAAMLEQAEGLLAAGSIDDAGQFFGAILQADPENPGALAGIAHCMIAMGDLARARELLEGLSEELRKDPKIQAASKKLDQIEEARKFGDPAALEHELALNPDHHEARMKLAKVRNAEGAREEAADHLLYIMKKDRSFEDDGARKQLIAFFEVWGPKDPATLSARRKLSSILFA